MSNDISLEGFEGHLVSTLDEAEGELRRDDTFRVALLGDWSGRANRQAVATADELATWRPRSVDRDNLDETMTKLGVRLSLPISVGTNISLQFNKLDDFHPDSIFEQAQLFRALRELRAKLSDQTTFADAAKEVRSRLHIDASQQPIAESSAESKPQSTGGGSLLDQILAGNETSSSNQTIDTQAVDRVAPDLRNFVHEIVRPYLLADNAEQESLIAAVDSAISAQMKSVLHNSEFQLLEAAWRALHFLVTRLETGSALKLYLLDISQKEIQSALATSEVNQNGIYKLLVNNSTGTFGGEGWSLLLGNYTFDYTLADAESLKRLSSIAAKAGAPFVGAASPNLVGSPSLFQRPDPSDSKMKSDEPAIEAWKGLRSQRDSSYIGLALPRFLLRLPYGSATEAIEKFDFEEFEPGGINHEHYLWANPSFAICYVLAQGFTQSGPKFRPEEMLEIEGLPLHVYDVDGEKQQSNHARKY